MTQITYEKFLDMCTPVAVTTGGIGKNKTLIADEESQKRIDPILTALSDSTGESKIQVGRKILDMFSANDDVLQVNLDEGFMKGKKCILLFNERIKGRMINDGLTWLFNTWKRNQSLIETF